MSRPRFLARSEAGDFGAQNVLSAESTDRDPRPANLAAARRALLIVNRRAYAGASDLGEALEILEAQGYAVTPFPTDDPDRIPEAIERTDAEVIIVGGGDGTLNTAAAPIMKRGLPLGILPLGTANDLARTLEIPLNAAGAAQVIVEDREHAIDLGSVNGRYFFNAASLGLAVQMTRLHDGERKRRWRLLSYLLSFPDAYRASRPFTARLRGDALERTIRALQITVGNGRHYGGGMVVAEDAQIDDQILTLYYLKPASFLAMVAAFPALRVGRQDAGDLAEVLRAREIEISTSRPMAVSTDGEITTQTPAHFALMPRAVRVFVPESYLAKRREDRHAAR